MKEQSAKRHLQPTMQASGNWMDQESKRYYFMAPMLKSRRELFLDIAARLPGRTAEECR